MFSLITRTVTHGFIILLHNLFLKIRFHHGFNDSWFTVILIKCSWNGDKIKAVNSQHGGKSCCHFPSMSCLCHMLNRLLETVKSEILIFMLVQIRRRAAKQKMEVLTGAAHPLDPCRALSLSSSQAELLQPPILPDVQFAHLSVVGSRWELTPDERVRTGGTCGRSAATSTYTKCARCVFIRVNICFFPPTKPGQKNGRLIGKAKCTKQAWIWLDLEYSTWNNAVTDRQEVRSKVKGSQVQTNGKHLDCLLMQILLLKTCFITLEFCGGPSYSCATDSDKSWA